MTLLGIDESLAFRAFDKTIIFGHWLLKTQKLALAPGPFPFEKDLYYPSRLFSKEQKYFFKREALRYFQHGALPLSSNALQFPSHANIG